jgi:hypothetical protein
MGGPRKIRIRLKLIKKYIFLNEFWRHVIPYPVASKSSTVCGVKDFADQFCSRCERFAFQLKADISFLHPIRCLGPRAIDLVGGVYYDGIPFISQIRQLGRMWFMATKTNGKRKVLLEVRKMFAI